MGLRQRQLESTKQMRTAHTTGPWETNGTAIETVATPSYVIGSAYEGDLVAIDQSTAEANARLMAAAPDLLATLKRAREELRMIEMKDCGAVYDTTLRIAMDMFISKTEG